MHWECAVHWPGSYQCECYFARFDFLLWRSLKRPPRSPLYNWSITIDSRELKQGRRQGQRQHLKTMIWLVEWGKIIVLHVRHALKYNSLTWSAKLQWEISKLKVLTTTWTHKNKSFILYIYFNGVSTSPFSACSVNNKGYKEDAIVTK